MHRTMMLQLEMTVAVYTASGLAMIDGVVVGCLLAVISGNGTLFASRTGVFMCHVDTCHVMS